MISNPKGMWSIQFREWEPGHAKTGTQYQVMKSRLDDGSLEAAERYDDVFRFLKYPEAFDFARELLATGRYDASVARVCRARGQSFYVSGN